MSGEPLGRRRPAGTRPAWWAELLVLGIGYAGYEVLRILAASSIDVAEDDAARVYGLERALHLNVESGWNTWLAAHSWGSALTGYYYVIAHFGVVSGVLVWLYVWRPWAYRYLRRVLALTSFAALAVFWWFPVAPPRLASPGFVDTVANEHILGASDSHSAPGWVNLYAAMPSLHVGWAMWAALALTVATAHRIRMLAWLYPAATGAAVIGTGNHYLLDVFAGAVLLLLCAAARRPGTAPGRTWFRSARRRVIAGHAWSRSASRATPGRDHPAQLGVRRS